MPPIVSVIIPAHNEEDYIRKTLHSLKNQTFQDFETIVVSNGCTDKTEEIVKKREGKKLRHFSLPRPNVSVSRNAGALNAEGGILLFLDADTILEKDALWKIKQEFADNYSVATTRIKPDSDKLKYKLAMKFKNFYNFTKIYQGCSGTLICRKKDFQSVGGYDPKIVVKEHRRLIIKLKKLGKYGCVNTYVTNSMRRFEQWGLARATWFWAQQLYQAWFGDLKESDYEKVR